VSKGADLIVNNFWAGRLWFILTAFLLLLLSGLILNLAIQTEISSFYWMIIPSILFEEMLKSSYLIIADIKIINFIFIFIFWFIVTI